MTYVRKFAPVLALLALANTGTAQTVSLRDYQVPVSRATSLTLDVSYDYFRNDVTTTANDATVRIAYRMFYDSLPLAYSVDVSGFGSRTWLMDDHQFLTDHAVSTTGRVNKYLSGERDLFASIAGSGQLRKQDDRPGSAVTVGVGAGRFIDATALRRAERMDRFFLEEGVTSARLPKETMLAVAGIIERQNEYRQTFGAATYRQRWYGDIEEAVRASGLLTTDRLGPVGVLRMEEVLFQENVADRFVGADATVGVRFDITIEDKDAPRPAPGLDLTLRYARPIAWTTQFDGSVVLNSPMESREFGSAYRLQSTLRGLYEMTNRVDVRVDYVLDLDKPVAGAPTIASHAILPSFLYYLENQVRLVAGVRIARPTGEPWTQELSLSLHYKAF